jgi:hypothetical protein
MWLAAFCLATACAVLAHGVICRLDIALDRVLRFLLVGSAVGAALLAVMVREFGFFSVETWAAVLGYAFACELYIFLFTFTISSISANLLMSLHRRALTLDEVDAIYDSERMVAQRLERLLQGGFLQMDGPALKVAPKGMRFHRFLRALCDLFRHS